jgi:hypothetical protein
MAKKPAGYGKMESSKKDMMADKKAGIKEGGKKDTKMDNAMMPKGKGIGIMVAIGKAPKGKK